MSHHHSTHRNDRGRLCTVAFPSSSRSSAPSPWENPSHSSLHLASSSDCLLNFFTFRSHYSSGPASPPQAFFKFSHRTSDKIMKNTLFFSNPQTNFLLIMSRLLTDMGNYSLSQSESSSPRPGANSRMSLDQHISSLLLPSPTHFGRAFTLLIVLFSSWIRPGPTLLGRPLGSCSSGNAHIAKTLVCFLHLYDPLTSITIL